MRARETAAGGCEAPAGGKIDMGTVGHGNAIIAQRPAIEGRPGLLIPTCRRCADNDVELRFCAANRGVSYQCRRCGRVGG